QTRSSIRYRWRCRLATGEYFATFSVPAEMTPEQAAKPRKLNFIRCDNNDQATELVRNEVRFGAAGPRALDENGQARFRWDELGDDLCLFIGTLPCECDPQPADGE